MVLDPDMSWTLASIALAYLVFGITAFGASMVALPFLVQAMPLTEAVPLVLLCDVVATPLVGLGNRKKADMGELRRLLPTLLAGVVLGSTLLAQAPTQVLLWLLGVFVLGVASHGLLTVHHLQASASTAWSWPSGFVGGVFSALFGTGGPIYTAYLARRIGDFETFRATTATVILTSAACRLAAFLIAGLLINPSVWQRALWAVPTCLVALWLGTRLRHHMNPMRLRRLVFQLLLLAGISVLWRAATA